MSLSSSPSSTSYSKPLPQDAQRIEQILNEHFALQRGEYQPKLIPMLLEFQYGQYPSLYLSLSSYIYFSIYLSVYI
jgi:hypothetical protein